MSSSSQKLLPDSSTTPTTVQADTILEEVDAEVFSTYECRSLPLTLGRGHPGDISEPGLLAAVTLPRMTYDTTAFMSDGDIVDKLKLSRLQLEGVLYACQRHMYILPGGTRAGFFIGDGAGVGKGRQIAGIILDSWVRGRRKHVWFSISTDLKSDARRDLSDVGCHINVIDGCQGLDLSSRKGLGMSKDAKQGCLFSTYSALVSSCRSGPVRKRSRLDQLVDWCGGKEFEGCLIFDEAHKAKNFNSAKEEASTKVAQTVIKIQTMLPRARILYCSATGVTDIGNLAYAERLGLWGLQAPFASFKDFKESMDKRGLGALEMLAMELKAKGSYVSRGLAWKGAEFETFQVRLPPSTVKLYDEAVSFWMDLRKELEQAAKVCGLEGKCSVDKCKDGHACSPMRMFWGQQQRFFKEVANSAKVKFVVEQAKEALSKGMSVVVGLQTTGESGMDKAMMDMGKKPGDHITEVISAARYGTAAFIRSSFPTRTRPTTLHVATDSEIEQSVVIQLQVHINAGKTTPFDAEAVRALLKEGRARQQALAVEMTRVREIPECAVTKENLLQRLMGLTLLRSTLDGLIDDLGGPDAVAEMTGRRGRLVRRGGNLRYELRHENENQETSLNIRERKMFMDGKKHVAIISDAASTGVSLHAAVGSKSEGRRRLHITLELPWSADKAIQQLGRSHRSNQASAPVFRLLVTDLGGERRFAAAVAKRLASLGALTKGDRRAATGADFSAFDFDTKYGRLALRNMYNSTAVGVVAAGVNIEKLRSHIEGGEAEVSSSTIGEKHTMQGLGPDHLCSALVVAATESVKDMAIDPKQYNNVTLFLGRLQGLPFRRQNLMFAYLMEVLDVTVGEARAAGTYDEGVADLRASSVSLKVPPEEIIRDPVTGAVTTLYQVVLDRGVSWDQALAKRAEALGIGTSPAAPDAIANGLLIGKGEGRGDDDGDGGDHTEHVNENSAPVVKEELLGNGDKVTGFYRSTFIDISTQKNLVLLAVRKARYHSHMVITRPNTGTSPMEMDLFDLRSKYTNVPDNEQSMNIIKEAWTQVYISTNGSDYRGSRKISLGLLSGSILPLWPALEKTVVACRSDMTRAEQALKVNRVILDDGRKLVGVRVPTTALGTLRLNLTELYKVRQIAVEGGEAGHAEDVKEVDLALLCRVKTAPKTMHSFFGSAAAFNSPPSQDSSVRSDAIGGKRKVEGLNGSGSLSSAKKKARSLGGSTATAAGMKALFGAKTNRQQSSPRNEFSADVGRKTLSGASFPGTEDSIVVLDD